MNAAALKVNLSALKMGGKIIVNTDGFDARNLRPVSYTHLRAHETVLDLVCRLLLEKKKKTKCNATTFITNNKRPTTS